MTRPPRTEIQMRLLIEGPVPDVVHSLQDRKSRPVDAKRSLSGESIGFDFSIQIGSGPKFYGEQVRSEGPERRFVYVAIGQQAGESGSRWSRRMKIDIQDIPQALLDGAIEGRRLLGTILGRGSDGTPACATVRVQSWRLE